MGTLGRSGMSCTVGMGTSGIVLIEEDTTEDIDPETETVASPIDPAASLTDPATDPATDEVALPRLSRKVGGSTPLNSAAWPSDTIKENPYASAAH